MGRGGTREMDRGHGRGETGQEKESDTESMEAVRDIRSSPSFNEKGREREEETPKKRWRVGCRKEPVAGRDVLVGEHSVHHRYHTD